MIALAHQSQSLPRRQYPQHYQSLSYNNSTNNSNININDTTPNTSHASTQNWVAAFSSPITPAQSDFDFSNSSNYIPSEQRNLYDLSAAEQSQDINNLRIQVQTPFGSNRDSDLMQSDHTVAPNSWNFTNGQLTPTSARSHYRESSLSSLGSAGPASPYTSSTSHPHVILAPDSVSEQYYDGLPIVDQSTYHHQHNNFSKPLTPSHTPSHDNNFLASSFSGYNPHSYHHDPNYSHIMAMQKQHHTGDDESMPAPEYAHSGRPSVASTHESPATPAAGEDYDDQSRKSGKHTLFTLASQPMNANQLMNI